MKTEISKSQKQIPKKRTNFVGKTVNNRVAELLARYYLSLRDKLCKGKHGNMLAMSYEDIFHNAIVKTIQDKETTKLTTDDEILAFFEKRYRSIEMEIVRDSRLINTTDADDIQAKAPAAE
ncbi:hypothetical protein DW083_19900 [Parabacteroides sp. AF48-14]|uniref:hypothetical protein n=1 Tax=Parabacteroides sp. AF48-14 TaxID=2292052 RepID=UPI000F000B14|nr:hypothetical protein [Parabacteroides sp. AF48-14]RHO65992.1 hypothetical protein DW083_19900 [Parabacteroides sp. AF48-14]